MNFEHIDHQMRKRIATEAGLPAGLASRLQGATPDELTADAAALAAGLPAPPPPPTHDALLTRVLADNREKHQALIDSLHPYPAEKESQ
jgi:hypothetical protein